MKKILYFICMLGIGLGYTNKLQAQCDGQLAYWDFNDCTKGFMIRDGLPPQTTVLGCPSEVTTMITRVTQANSCADRAAGNRANCLGSNDLNAWEDGADDAVVITVSYPAGSTGKLSGLSFIQGLHDIAEFNGEPNNPLTLWGIRVVKNGTEIFKEIDKPFVLNAWTLRTFDWSSNPDFNVSGATTFRIELLGYSPSTTINVGASQNIWEIDDVTVLGGCCSVTPTCNLASGGLTAVTCKDNSTPSVTTDDYIEFKLNPTGTGIGSKYTVSVSSGTITPTSATYGVATTFRLQNGSAGSGNKTITIKDKTNPSCTTTVTVTDPGTCSTVVLCSISGTVSNIACDDNSTTTNATDDKITFQLNVTGTGTGSSYNVTVQGGGAITPTSGSYGSAVTFTMAAGTAGGGNKTIIVTDATTGTCAFSKIIQDPGSCSATCPNPLYPLCPGESYRLTAQAGLTNYQWMQDTGSGFVNISGATSQIYDATSAGKYKYVAKDANGCDIELCCPYEITTATCIPPCSLTDSGIGAINCNNNGTTANPLDDKITFSLNPTGTGLSGTYLVSVQGGGGVSPTSASYGIATDFTLAAGSAGNGNVVIVITDATNSSCVVNATITDPGACSCSLTTANISNISCSNNGTTSTTDDRISFVLNPVGLAGRTYSVSVNSGNISPSTGIYGISTLFVLNAGSAGGGNKTVTVTDDDDPTCKVTATVNDPGPCSSCQINDPLVAYVICDNKGTVSTADDEFILYTNPDGIGISTTYDVSVTCSGSACVCSKTGVTYGTPQEICRLPVGFNIATVTVTDASGASCSVVGTVPEGTCSINCNITDAGMTIICDNKGTTITSDDTYTIYLNPTGTGLSSRYHITGDYDFLFVPYGAAFAIAVDIPVNSGAKTIVITDASSATCTFNLSIPNQACVTCTPPAAGSDVTICLPKTTLDLTDAPSGTTWSVGIGNPATATINSTTGEITGLTVVGTYTFVLANTSDANCKDEMQVIVTAGDAPIVLCNDGSTSYSLVAPSNLTNVIWYNMAGTQVGTGNTLTVTSNTTGLTDGSEAFYYIGVDGSNSGCDVELCCPVKFTTQACCPKPNCVDITVIKN